MVHAIVENHGGLITVSSKPGKGTTVSVSLPVLEVPAVAEPLPVGCPHRSAGQAASDARGLVPGAPRATASSIARSASSGRAARRSVCASSSAA